MEQSSRPEEGETEEQEELLCLRELQRQRDTERRADFLVTCTDILSEAFSYLIGKATKPKNIAAVQLTCTAWAYAFDYLPGSKSTIAGRMILCQKIRNCERLVRDTEVDDEERRLLAIESGREAGDLLRDEIDGAVIRQSGDEEQLRTSLHHALSASSKEYQRARAVVMKLQQGDVNRLEFLADDPPHEALAYIAKECCSILSIKAPKTKTKKLFENEEFTTFRDALFNSLQAVQNRVLNRVDPDKLLLKSFGRGMEIGSRTDDFEETIVAHQSKAFAAFFGWLKALKALLRSTTSEVRGWKDELARTTAKRSGLLDLHRRCVAAVDDLVLPPALRELVWAKSLKRKKILKKWKADLPAWRELGEGQLFASPSSSVHQMLQSPLVGAAGSPPAHNKQQSPQEQKATRPGSARGQHWSPQMASPQHHAANFDEDVGAEEADEVPQVPNWVSSHPTLGDGSRRLQHHSSSSSASLPPANAALPTLQQPRKSEADSAASMQAILEMTRQFSDTPAE